MILTKETPNNSEESKSNGNKKLKRLIRRSNRTGAEKTPEQVQKINKVTPPTKALSKVRKIADHEIGESNPDQRAYFMDSVEKREAEASPYKPTIGIEIEIYDPTLLTVDQKKLPIELQETFLEIIKQRFEKTEHAGIPRDYSDEGYWEFALPPSNDFRTQLRIVQSLIDMGLINMEAKPNPRHPIHITIEGIDLLGESGWQTNVLARVLEASGWSVTSGRLLKPYLKRSNAWTSGESGVLEREEIRAIEFRTNQLQSLEGLYRTLSAAQYLGAALGAYQDKYRADHPEDREEEGYFSMGKFAREIKSGSTREERDQLAQIWEEFSKAVEGIFASYNLRSPSESWKEPYHHGPFRSKGDYGGLAELLLQAKTDENSEGKRFQTEVRDLIIQTRTKIAKIIDKTIEQQ